MASCYCWKPLVLCVTWWRNGGALGLDPQQEQLRESPLHGSVSVWAHISVTIQVQPGDPQSSAGATWALGDVAGATQEKAAPAWPPGHRLSVVTVWPHTVCSMPAAGLKSKHCLAVITKKKKWSHYSPHVQWYLSYGFKGVDWVLNFCL